MTSTGRDKPPQISLPVAEILYVALDHVLNAVEDRDDVTALVENMRRVMKTYGKYRTAVLVKRGDSPEDARRYTDVARQSLHRWLTMQASKRIELQADFDRWTEELTSDDD